MMTHLYTTTHVRRDQFLRDVTPLYVTWLICTWHEWFIHPCSYSYIIYLSSLVSHHPMSCDIHTWDIPHLRAEMRYVSRWRGSFARDMTILYVTWLLCTWHDWFIHLCSTSYIIYLSSLLSSCRTKLNPVYNAFHRRSGCGNKSIRQ